MISIFILTYLLFLSNVGKNIERKRKGNESWKKKYFFKIIALLIFKI